jgi:hypothetical protein
LGQGDLTDIIVKNNMTLRQRSQEHQKPPEVERDKNRISPWMPERV